MKDPKENLDSRTGKALAELMNRVELGDLLLCLYALVIVRQYFWIVDNNSIAWALSVPVAALGWYLYVKTKQFAAETFGRSFWLVVGVPLLVAYLLRAAFPDRSYDVLHYHLLHAERTLRGTLFGTGDFFASAVPFNPIADTVTGISRLFLGYRLGTVINLLALIWAGQVTDKILRSFVENRWVRAACVLLVLLSEHLLFEISTYMVDLLTLPLMFEATLLTLRFDEARNRQANLLHVALLLGVSTAFKLTNLAVALPILAVCAYQAVVGPQRLPFRQLMTSALLASVAFIAPLLPFTVYIFRMTGNPVFPAANSFFKSVYWPTHGGWDNRFGPETIWEAIVWPVLIWFKPERGSELAVYSGRLSFGFLVAIAGLAFAWRNPRVRILCIILISSALLWSAVAIGYNRYGLYQEMLAGIAVIAVGLALMAKIPRPNFAFKIAMASVVFGVLLVQAYFACSYGLKKEWGTRNTFFADHNAYAQEVRLFLRDRSLKSFLTDDERALFDSVQLWVETCPMSTGFEVLLNPNAPIVTARQPEYFFTRESWQQFIRVIEQSSGKRMFSLCLANSVPPPEQAIAERGLEIKKLTPVNLPFFSPRDRIGMMLVEVQIPQEPEKRSAFESAWMKGAFPASVYRHEIVALDAPSVMQPGQKVNIRFKVKNLGSSSWPAVGTKDFRYQVNLGNHWIGAGTTVEDNRAAMKADLPPGGETEMTLTVNAPRTPGEYTLEIDLVHEGVTWFSERGARPLRLSVRVAA